MNKGFASIIFILLMFLFIILQSFYLLINKTEILALTNLKRRQKSTQIFKEHYNKLNNIINNQAMQSSNNPNIITNWGERYIITPCYYDGQNWLIQYEDTYVQ
jgi:hypothetical protein